MASNFLNKGIKLAADTTVIKLNNRVFETSAGTGFITIRPDVATTNGMVTLLDPGKTTGAATDGGYVKVSINHVDAGLPTAGFYWVVQTLGSAGQIINTLQSDRVSYGTESTLGLTYDAITGTLKFALNSVDAIFTPTNNTAFTAGVVPILSGLNLTTTADAAQSIGIDKYSGYLSKIATYHSVFSADDLKKYVDNPAILPTKDQVLLLDATQLNEVSRVNNSIPEVQKLTFGAASASGAILIDGGSNNPGWGAKVLIAKGDSGTTIAAKVNAAIAEHPLFKPQLEKQLISFTPGTTGTSFNIAGVTVTINTPDPVRAWTRLVGTSSRDYAMALTTGLDGAIYVSGDTNGLLDGQTNSGAQDGFLTKYNADGTKAWTRLLGTSTIEHATALTTGVDGSIYVSGFTDGALDGQANNGNTDAFLAKYSANGTKAWTKLLGSSGHEAARALTTGLDGSIFVSGSTNGALDGQVNSGGEDAFLTKYSADGAKIWTKLLGTSSGDSALALTTGLDGSIYVSGSVGGALDGQANNGGDDAFLTKYSADGAKAWTKLLGTAGRDLTYALTTGLDGSIYLGGGTTGALDGQSNSGNSDAFLTKFGTDGTKVWTKLLGTSGWDNARALTTGLDGSIYVSGDTSGAIDGQSHSGIEDTFLTKYSADGIKAWTRQLGTSLPDISFALTTGLDGAVYTSGITTGGLGGQTNSGSDDGFLVKYQEISDPKVIASTAKTSLDASTFITGTPGRVVQDNGDGSILVTFASADTDAPPIPVNSTGTSIAASVDTVQTFNASGIGRKVTTDGASVLISLNLADLNAKDLYVAVGSTGVTVTSPTTVANHTKELTSFIPSTFNFEGTPVGEIQRMVVNAGAAGSGETLGLTINGVTGVTATNVAIPPNPLGAGTAYTTSGTATAIASWLNTNIANLTGVDKVTAIGDFVDVQFKAAVGNVADITIPTNNTAKAILLTPQQYASNLTGETQTITFTTATSAGNIVVDGITVAIASGDTPSAIATKVQKSLVDFGVSDPGITTGKYSIPETQALTFTNASATAGNITVNGVTVTLATTDNTPALIAVKAAAALNTVANNNYFASTDGDTLLVTFDNVARDAPMLTGLVAGTRVGDTATAFTTRTEFNANGTRTTRINTDGSLGIDFRPWEGTPAERGNVAPIKVDTAGYLATGKQASLSVVAPANAFFNPANGHYYKWIPKNGITWLQAKDLAEGTVLNNEIGYLATITTVQELNFIDTVVVASLPPAFLNNGRPDNTYIGGSDALQQGVWRWVTGPEGKSSGGAGLVFFNQGQFVGEKVTDWQTRGGMFWNTPGGDYLTLYSWWEPLFRPWTPGAIGAPVSNGPAGYLVEWGGGDPAPTSASVATTVEAHSQKVTTSSYGGTAVTNAGVPSSNALYAELISVGKVSANSKQLIFELFLDPSLKSNALIGDGYESVSFTLNYSTADINPGSVKIEMASSNSPLITNLNTPGKITARWLDLRSATDFTKPIARVTVDQVGVSGVFRDKLELTFTSVDIDGVDLTNGTTYARAVDESLRPDRWDIKHQLVNGLDSVTPLGGELVGYYGSPTVVGSHLSLRYASFKDQVAAGIVGAPASPAVTLGSANKTLTLDVVSGVAGLTSADFVVELPSEVTNARFTLSPAAVSAGLTLIPASATVTQGLVGHYYNVKLKGSHIGGLAKDTTIGTLSLDLIEGQNKTFEFLFGDSSTLNTATVATQGVYFGYTTTEASTKNITTGLVKGEWVAKDMPKGSFNKFFVSTAPLNPSKLITSADALQILKLSAGYGLDWKTGAIPDGTFAAADMDGSGKVTAADALIALKYATGILPTVDPVKWKFYDSSTANLSAESTRITEALRAGMAVTGGTDVEITASNALKDYFVQAILVGNVTNPALEI